MRATCPAHVTLLDKITLITVSKDVAQSHAYDPKMVLFYISVPLHSLGICTCPFLLSILVHLTTAYVTCIGSNDRTTMNDKFEEKWKEDMAYSTPCFPGFEWEK
jgi:hypothetical protein